MRRGEIVYFFPRLCSLCPLNCGLCHILNLLFLIGPFHLCLYLPVSFSRPSSSVELCTVSVVSAILSSVKSYMVGHTIVRIVLFLFLFYHQCFHWCFAPVWLHCSLQMCVCLCVCVCLGGERQNRETVKEGCHNIVPPLPSLSPSCTVYLCGVWGLRPKSSWMVNCVFYHLSCVCVYTFFFMSAFILHDHYIILGT